MLRHVEKRNSNFAEIFGLNGFAHNGAILKILSLPVLYLTSLWIGLLIILTLGLYLGSKFSTTRRYLLIDLDGGNVPLSLVANQRRGFRGGFTAL